MFREKEQPQGRTFESEDLLFGAVVLDLYNPLALLDGAFCLLQLFVEFCRPYVQPLKFSHCLGNVGPIHVQLGTGRERGSQVPYDYGASQACTSVLPAMSSTRSSILDHSSRSPQPPPRPSSTPPSLPRTPVVGSPGDRDPLC